MFPVSLRTVQSTKFDGGFLRAPSGANCTSHCTSHISGKELFFFLSLSKSH